MRFVVCGLASPAISVLILFLAAIAKAPPAISMLLPLFFVFVRMCGLKQQPICASLCDEDPIIFACLKQVLHFLQPRLATLTSLAGFCIFQPAPSRLQHFSARPPAWFSGRLKSPDFRQAGSLAARQAQAWPQPAQVMHPVRCYEHYKSTSTFHDLAICGRCRFCGIPTTFDRDPVIGSF